MAPKKRNSTNLETRIFDKDAVDDLVLLSTVSEESICKNLETCFLRDECARLAAPRLTCPRPERRARPPAAASTPTSGPCC